MRQCGRVFVATILLTLGNVAAACGTDDEPAAGHYETREASRFGTGKVYMGREIAGVMSHRRMDRLDRPQREREERPDLLVEALPLDKDDVVADIGAGTGYFSFRVAARVPDGEVLAVDIQQEMLDEIERRKRERGVDNVRTVLGDIDDPCLELHSADVMFIVNSYHEFSHPHEMGRGMFAALRPGGHLVVVEKRAEDDDGGPVNLHRMTEAQARQELTAVGFDWVRTETFLPQQHYLVFRKPAAAGAREIYPGYAWAQVGAGIYLHRRVDPFAGPIDGNSVVIVNDDAVIVVDTHINPAAARAVIAQIRQITDNPVTHVVNTHWHDDHTNGNAAYRDAFPDAVFVAHSATLGALRKEWPAMKDQRVAAYRKTSVDALLEAADRLEPADPDKAIGYRIYAGYVEALQPELPGLELVYPDTVFEKRLVLGSGGRTVILEWLGRGNTDGDVIVWLPQDRLLITGDVLVAPIPYAFDSPMAEWIDTLDRLAKKNAQTIVPGHGAVHHDGRYIGAVRRLLEATMTEVRTAQAAGVAYADLADAVDLSDQKARFVRDDPRYRHAWRAYFLEPGVRSAWAALGFAVPDDQ